MKNKLMLTTSVLATIIALSTGVQGADPVDSAAEVKAPAPTAKKMKPHSHAEEKSGMPMQMQEPKDEVKAAAPVATDTKKQHLHPRDGK